MSTQDKPECPGLIEAGRRFGKRAVDEQSARLIAARRDLTKTGRGTAGQPEPTTPRTPRAGAAGRAEALRRFSPPSGDDAA